MAHDRCEEHPARSELVKRLWKSTIDSRQTSPRVQDAPEPFRSALADSISPQESIRLLIHAPAFSTLGERSFPTVLAVADKVWLLVSETEDGGAHAEKAAFCDTLFLELALIHLSGQFRIHFAKVGISYSATTTFDTVEESLYREEIDVILDGIDPNSSRVIDPKVSRCWLQSSSRLFSVVIGENFVPQQRY